ncbi:MAG: sigma-70 family RNA polymerase sigma factor [Planctomycetota bacterium]|nr:MAG: sigma-70 family RNA polymerase sigma factor [Planctomycetota bacterium]
MTGLPSADRSHPTREVTLSIVGRAQQGDAQAADDLVRRMTGRVYGLILLYMGPQVHRRCEPEDVLQEVWIEALGHLDSFDCARGSSFGAWIGTIVRRKLGRIADGKPLPEVAAGLAGSASTRASVSQILHGRDATTPPQAASQREMVQRLVAAVAALPGEQREAAAAYWLEECSAQEVADRLGKSRAAVYMLLMRVSRLLAAELEDAGLSDPARW